MNIHDYLLIKTSNILVITKSNNQKLFIDQKNNLSYSIQQFGNTIIVGDETTEIYQNTIYTLSNDEILFQLTAATSKNIKTIKSYKIATLKRFK